MDYIKRILFLHIIITVCLCANAQNNRISGKILCSKDSKTVSDVNVVLQGTRFHSISGNEGNFVLSEIPDGNYTLSISAIGYEPEQRNMAIYDNIENIIIKIEEKDIELSQIVITATRTERNLKDVPIAVQIISGKSIEKMQIPTMRDLLEYELSGVEFTNNGGHANINMLGFGGKYVLFLIDGERMAGESFDNVDYNRFNMENIERIEVIKGASSSLYGSNAMGGVINIITKKPAEAINAHASIRVGSENEHNYNLLLDSKQNWGSVSLTASYKNRNPYLLKDRSPLTMEFANGEIIEQTLKETYIAGYEDYNITPKLNVRISPKFDIEAKGGYYFKERQPGGLEGRKVRDHFYDYSGGLKGRYSISGNQHFSFSGNYDRYDKYDYYKLLNEKEKNYENSQLRFNALYDLMIENKHSLVAGFEYLSDKLMTFMFNSDGENDNRYARTYSLFVQQDWVLSDKITLVGGFRFDYHSLFKEHLSPRLSAMYRPTHNITIRGGYAGGFRSPTLKELYTDWFHPYGGGFQIIGNKDMQAEISNNFNLSAEAIWGKSLITAMTQYSIIDNKINAVWCNDDTIQYVNMGKAKIFSAELSASRQLNRDIRVKGSYAYVRDDLEKKSIVRPHTATLRIDYSSSLFKKFNPILSFSGKYFSSMNTYGTSDISETDNETGISKDVSEEYKVHYDAYSIWKLTYAQPLPYNFYLNAGINNIFDYKPKFSSFYSSISSGRTFYIGFKWKLK